MNEMVLQVQNLTTQFFTRRGVATAVRDVSFHLEKGEVLGIVGESGSGKSVTGMSIMGQVANPGKIVSGSILFRGEDLVGLDAEKMRQHRGRDIAMVLQNPMMTLNPLMRVRNQMFEALEAHMDLPRAEKEKRCVAALKAVGIPSAEERMNAYPHELSGGMRQRVVIAVALLMDPDIIIADEPTTALDVTIQAQIIHNVRNLVSERGRSMIWISHDLATLSEMSDRILVMYAGAVMEVGTTAEIIGSPRHPYTHKLLQAIPSGTERGQQLAQIPGTIPSLYDLGPGCPFAERCARATAQCREPIPERHLSQTHVLHCVNPVN